MQILYLSDLSISNVASITASRETLHAEKYEGYFNFKQLKICAYINSDDNSLLIIYYSYAPLATTDFS
jgi:hypothetical protein